MENCNNSCHSVNQVIRDWVLSLEQKAEILRDDASNKVAFVAQKCFAVFIKILALPVRFFGAKDWSIGGVLLRLPLEIIDRIAKKKPWTWESLRQDLFESHGYQRYFTELEPEEIKPYIRYAAASGAVKNSNISWIQQFGYESLDLPDLRLPKGLQKCHELEKPGQSIHKEHDRNVFYDPGSGLKVFVALDPQTNEVIVSFGALAGGDPECEKDSERTRRVFGNLGHIFWNYVGGVPSICKQGSSFVQALKEHPLIQGKKIVLTGLSMGGMIAQYAALDQEVTAICLNSVALGVGCQYELGDKKLAQSQNYITQISAEWDITSADYCSRFVDQVLSLAAGIRFPGNFGKHYVIPSAYQGPGDTHGYIMGSMMEYAGYGKRRTTRPHELGQVEEKAGLRLDDDLFAFAHSKYRSPFVDRAYVRDEENFLFEIDDRLFA